MNDMIDEELLAQFKHRLGPNYDKVKIAEIASLQIAMRAKKEQLVEEFMNKSRCAESYVDAMNDLFVSTCTKCEAVLGKADFEKFFDVPLAKITGIIDKETFLASQREISKKTFVD
ncbi:MAG: hypothetical protein HYT94_02270 [Parcubacteria group bacterium]|nr:hypothetical protein [Parcubacteria group bacterium]